HAIARGIHARQLPARTDLPLVGGIAIGFDRLVLVTVLVGRVTEAENRPGARFLCLEPLLVKRVRGYHAARHRSGKGSAEQARLDRVRYLHSSAFLSLHLDG